MVAAHGAIAYLSDMPGDDVAALWLVVAAVAAAATSLRRGRVTTSPPALTPHSSVSKKGVVY